MKCTVCGYEFTEGKKYCPLCGAKVQYKEAPVVKAAAAEEKAPAPAPVSDASRRRYQDELLRSIELKYASAPVPQDTAAEKAAEEAARAEEAKRLAEQEAARRAAEEAARAEEAKKLAEQEAARRAAEEAARAEEAKKLAEQEAARKAAEEAARAEEAKRLAEQEAARKAAEEAQKAENEAKLAENLSYVDKFFAEREAEKTRAQETPIITWNTEDIAKSAAVKDTESLPDWSLYETKPKAKEESDDLSWISLDFPKPREVKDITMAWNQPLVPAKTEAAPVEELVWPSIGISPSAESKESEPLQHEISVQVRNENDGHFVMPSWTDLTYTRPSFTEEERAKLAAAGFTGADQTKAPANEDWEESIRKAAQEQAAEEARRKAEEEAEALRAAEEARRKAEEEAEALRAAEEAKRKAEEEAEALRAAEEAKRKAEEEAEALKAAEEAKRKAEDPLVELDFTLSGSSDNEPTRSYNGFVQQLDPADAEDFEPQEEETSEYETLTEPDNTEEKKPAPQIGFVAGGFIDPADVEPKAIRHTPFVQPFEDRPSAEFNWSQAPDDVLSFHPRRETAEAQPEETGAETDAPVTSEELQPVPGANEAEIPETAENEPAAEGEETEEKEQPEKIEEDVPADDEWLNQLVNDPEGFLLAESNTENLPGEAQSFLEVPIEEPAEESVTIPGDADTLIKETEPEPKNLQAGPAMFQELLDKELNRIRNGQPAEETEEKPAVDSMTHVFPRFNFDGESFETVTKAPISDQNEENPEAGITLEETEDNGELSFEELTSESETDGRASEAAPEKKETKEKKEEKPPIKFVEITSTLGAEAFSRNTVELKMAQMKEAEEAEAKHRSEYKKKLEEMSKAREAFFAHEEDPADRKARRAARKAAEEAEAARLQALENEEDDDKDGEGSPLSTDTASLTEEDRKMIDRKSARKIHLGGDDDDEDEKGHPLLVFILVLALIFGLGKATVIGLQHFKPDSTATTIATQLDQAFSDAARTGIKAVKKTVDKVTKKDDQKNESPNTSKAGGPVEGVDMLRLTAENNTNINAVAYDRSLVLVDELSSSYTDLADCPVSQDADLINAIYAIMISYDSAWNDYVNGTGDRVLEYLVADGDAYGRAIKYQANPDMTQQFNKLSLGEVRTFDGGAYVFAEEDITISAKDGNASDFDDKMVYCLVKIGDSFKIDSYSEYK